MYSFDEQISSSRSFIQIIEDSFENPRKGSYDLNEYGLENSHSSEQKRYKPSSRYMKASISFSQMINDPSPAKKSRMEILHEKLEHSLPKDTKTPISED